MLNWSRAVYEQRIKTGKLQLSACPKCYWFVMCGIWISSGGSHFEGSNFLWLPTVHWCIDVYCKDVTAGVCLHPPSNKNKNTHLHFWQSSLIHALQCPSVPFSARRNRLESGSWNTYLDLQCRHRGHLGRTECDAVFFYVGSLLLFVFAANWIWICDMVGYGIGRLKEFEGHGHRTSCWFLMFFLCKVLYMSCRWQVRPQSGTDQDD